MNTLTKWNWNLMNWLWLILDYYWTIELEEGRGRIEFWRVEWMKWKEYDSLFCSFSWMQKKFFFNSILSFLIPCDFNSNFSIFSNFCHFFVEVPVCLVLKKQKKGGKEMNGKLKLDLNEWNKNCSFFVRSDNHFQILKFIFFFFNSFADLCFIDLFKKKKKEKKRKKKKNRRLLFIGNGKTGQTEKKKNWNWKKNDKKVKIRY